MSGVKVGVLADDLSGALNIGVEFSITGLHTQVINVCRFDAVPSEVDVLIINTETRNISPDAAQVRVKQAAQKLAVSPLIVKKIDSLLRGAIGQEVDAAMDVVGVTKCLLIAASPKIGRQTIGGYHLVDAMPLAARRAQLDPSSTVIGSNVLQVIAAQTTRQVSHLDLTTIGHSHLDLAAEIEKLPAGIMIADCADQHDLNRAVRAAYTAGIRFFAGTYGMGEAVSALVVKRRCPLLVVVGSLSAACESQVKRLVTTEDLRHVAVTYDESFFDANVTEFAAPYARQLQSGAESDTVIQVSSPQTVQLWPWAEKRGHDRAYVSERIDALLKTLIEPVLADYKGLIASGGTTAQIVYQLLEADGLILSDREVIAGVPASRVVGGPYVGLPFIAKPGSQGNDRALCQLLQFMRQIPE